MQLCEEKQAINILLALLPFTYIIANQCLKYSTSAYVQDAVLPLRLHQHIKNKSKQNHIERPVEAVA